MFKFKSFFYTLLLLSIITCSITLSQDKALTFKDVMKFKQIKSETISDMGNWIGYTADPDRGNGEAVIISSDGKDKFVFERGNDPKFSSDENYAAIKLIPNFIELEKSKKDKPNNHLIFLNFKSRDTTLIEDVKSFAFSEDSKWLAVHHYEEKDTSENKKGKNEKNEEAGTTLEFFQTDNLTSQSIEFVENFAFDSSSNYLAYTIKDTSGDVNGLFLLNLKNELNKIIIDTTANGSYSKLNWHRNGTLAYLKSIEDKDKKDIPADIYLWNDDKTLIAASNNSPEGWMIPSQNNLKWTKDGERLFFGFRPAEENNINENSADTTDVDIYDFKKILEDKEVNVWHWDDPLIKTNEANEFKDKQKQTYPAVYHLDKNKIVQLTNLEVPYIKQAENPNYILSYSGKPYLKERTWDGWYFDYYVTDLNSGEMKKILNRLNYNAQLSPDGNYVCYYKDDNWYLYDLKKDIHTNLTSDLLVKFSNELHDYPSDPPGYGIAGWLENDNGVLINDRYDIWRFDTKNYSAKNITGSFGRNNKIVLRTLDIDKDRDYIFKNEKLILSGYHDSLKYKGFYSTNVNNEIVNPLLIDDEKNYQFKEKAKDENKILITREDYNEFPDLWITNLKFDSPKKLTELNNQTDGFAWGTSELVTWKNLDGVDMQGVLIKPGNYEEKKRYPVLVYFYRYFSQRLNNFPDMVVNHRPNFALYASNGYCVFLPDVVFEVGRPGFSATKSLVPGIQKLIDMGVADPDGIALHGHSWSGYQTAFVITQTDIFACAIAGAPVSNMTSAYSGIRWGSGLARQFQYEKSQSRIGGSLWQVPERYIENSPVFFADKITTPLLIMHGDEDGAVPWYQSIEMYLAMRRLGKECIFLQYKGEPHHLKKYPNKLDYSMKMKEFIDHYCKDLPAANWITKGVPYSE